ncbi:MAG: PEP-CTERM sorting domain-containing protein [Phycisphaerae bacterium]|nr:PEP-CTERM sorting domain-containing protein [Phycisphaerae bacterium]
MRYGCVILMFVLANVACGGVVSISEWHYIRGWAGGWGNAGQSYERSASFPISDSATALGWNDVPVTASSSAGNWMVSASVTGSIFSGVATAESTYVFTTECPVLSLKITGAACMYSWDGTVVRYRLTDRTLDETIFSYSSSTSHEYDCITVSESYRVNVQPGHEYELFLSAVASQGDDSTPHSWLAVRVPAPGALVLSSLGVAAVCWRRHGWARRA